MVPVGVAVDYNSAMNLATLGVGKLGSLAIMVGAANLEVAGDA